MSDKEIAGADLDGTPCVTCGEPVEQGQDVYVDRDASEDGERRREILSVMHVVCPSEAA